MMNEEFFLGEFLPLISSCNFYMYYEHAKKTSKITIFKNEIIIDFGECDDLDSITLILPKGVVFQPNSISGINKAEQSWLLFRVQLDEQTRIVNTVYSAMVEELSTLNTNQRDIEQCFANAKSSPNFFSINCKSCNASITGCILLSHFSALPSLDWDHSSEMWFCHIHELELESLKKHRIKVKDNECLYDELSIYLNSNHALHCRKKDLTLLCSGCNLPIGVTHPGSVVSFWLNCINWMSNDELIYSISEKEILISLVDNVTKSSLGINCRLVFYSKANRYLFLTIMDNNLTVLVTKAFSSPSQKRKFCETKNIIHLEKTMVIKVLFKVKVAEDEESGNWFDDTNIHMLPCGDAFLDAICLTLEQSNETIPNSLRNIDDMKIGFIMR